MAGLPQRRLAARIARDLVGTQRRRQFVEHAIDIFVAVNAAEPRPDQLEFRGLFKELVETNTAASNGSCTLAAERMAAWEHAVRKVTAP